MKPKSDKMKLNERSVVHYATCNSAADKTGHLYKKGERNTTYHRRWFVLKGNMLFYFEDKESKEPIGVIVLEGCTVELCESMEEYAFAVKFSCAKSRTYKMAAESQAAMESWVKALSRASFDYMRLVVHELEKQLEEMQTLHGLSGTPRSHKKSSGRAKSKSISAVGPAVATSAKGPQATYNCSHEETVHFTPTEKENGVARNKPSIVVNGLYPTYQGSKTLPGESCNSDGTKPPPVPPRRKTTTGRVTSTLESPVSPGTVCFSKLHDWYGKEITALRTQWQQDQ
ncbi:sesquipedalian-1-like [Polyodon spathula]|nr:sesquipedalian-1-like [Polyodon spathula]XP_041083268.1 sesquipedalian-1-like [Polyodon spathula]